MRACGRDSSKRTAAPSDMMKPERRESKGLEAWCGRALKAVVKDRVRSNDVNVSGWMQDSEPPASITLASPCDMKRDASPIECAPVVQAVLTEWEGPCAGGVRMREGRGKGKGCGGGGGNLEPVFH